MESTYVLTIEGGTTETFDFDYFMFKLMKESEEARHFLTHEGKSTGAGGSWEDLEGDLRAHSKLYPDLLIFVKEDWYYENSGETRHYFRNGEYKQIEPKQIWPEFHEVAWT